MQSYRLATDDEEYDDTEPEVWWDEEEEDLPENYEGEDQ